MVCPRPPMAGPLPAGPVVALLLATGLLACGEAPIEDPTRPDAAPADAPDAGPERLDLRGLVRAARLDALEAGLDAAGLAQALDGASPWTVLGPVDEAFAAAALPADPRLRAHVLGAHLLVGAVGSTDLEGARTVSGLDLSLGRTGPFDARLGAPVDRAATNGILHVLRDVLRVPRIDELDRARPDLSRMAGLVAAAAPKTRAPLAAGGPITLFVPRNAAFDDARVEDVDAALSRHAVAGLWDEAALSAGVELDTASGARFRAEKVDGALTVSGEGFRATVVEADLGFANGVVHVVDRVFLPPQETGPRTVVDELESAGFGAFVELVGQAGLLAHLSSEGPFTVLAPTDRAVQAVAASLPRTPDLLASYVLQHVLPERLTAEALSRRASVTTAARVDYPVTAGPGGPAVAERGVDPLDREADNGIVHGLDGLIVPPTLVEYLTTRRAFGRLAELAGRPSEEALRQLFLSRGGVTLFAPDDEALEGTRLPTDAEGAAAFLADHVATAFFPVERLQRGMTTQSGRTIRLARGRNGVDLLDGEGTQIPLRPEPTDVRLRDGVLHGISGPLRFPR